MKPVKARIVIGLLVIAVSASMLAWGFWPLRMEQRTVPITPTDLGLPPSGIQPGPVAQQVLTSTPLELVTEWPAAIRTGDTAPIRMIIRPDGQTDGKGQQGEAQVQAVADKNEEPGQDGLYQPVAQGRLEIFGLEYRPLGVINEALIPGKEVRFLWDVRPGEAGLFPGTLWLHVRFLPRPGGAEVRKVIAAQAIDIQARKFLGLDGNNARIFGSIGLVLGAMIAVDFFTLVSELLFPKKPGSQGGDK